MINVIEFLFEGFVKQQIDPAKDMGDIIQIAQDLSNIGFKENDIENALCWLNHTMFQYETLAEINDVKSTRIYNQFELKKLTPEARSLLYFLEQNKLITPSIREFAIERAMELQTNFIGKHELQWVLLFVMMNKKAYEDVITHLKDALTGLALSNTRRENLFEA